MDCILDRIGTITLADPTSYCTTQPARETKTTTTRPQMTPPQWAKFLYIIFTLVYIILNCLG
jgi:hypothetical protein